MTADQGGVGAESGADAPTRSHRLASLVSDSLGPLPPLAALCGAGALHASIAAGIGWGLLAMFFAAILPYAVTWRVRHPADGTRPDRGTRGLYMALAVVTAAVGITVLTLLAAPLAVVDVTVTIMIALSVVAVTNAWWRWSNHMAASAAGVSMLVVLFGPAALVAAVALPAVAWSRRALGRHSGRELLLGALCGAGVSVPVLVALL